MTTVVAENVTSRLIAASEIHVPEPYEPDNHTAKANLAGLTVSIVALGMLEPIHAAATATATSWSTAPSASVPALTRGLSKCRRWSPRPTDRLRAKGRVHEMPGPCPPA